MTNIFKKNLLSFILLFNFGSVKPVIDYLDTTFGANATGIVETTIGTSSRINSIAPYTSGRIVTAGLTTLSGVQNIIVARYNSNGTLDNSFGSNGVVTTLSGTASYANTVAIDSSNNILIAGLSVISGANNILIARYLSNGTLDNNFGVGGQVTKLIGTSATANSMIIDANGKLVIAGTAIISGKNNLFVVRYNSNGTIDTTFGSGGIKTLTANSGYTANSVTIDQNAKIVVGGSIAPNSTTSNFLIVRLNVNGTTDSTFGTNGIVTTAIPGAALSSIKSITIDSSDRIVVGGYSGSATNSNFTLARYNTNGTLDTTFGVNVNGIQVTTIGSNSQINSILIDQSGEIMAGGFSGGQFAAARYLVNGSLDTTFGVTGILTNTLGTSDQINSLLVQALDGRIVAGGNANDSGQSQTTLLRYNKNNTDFVNITTLTNNATVNTKIPVIAGTSSAANAQVQVLLNGTIFTTTATDGSGNWDAGTTNVLPIGANTVQVNLIVSSNIIVSEAMNFTVLDNLSDEALFAYSTQSQTSIDINYDPLAFNNFPRMGSWSYSNSTFTCNKSGIYLIQYTGNANVSGTIGAETVSVNIAMAVALNSIEYLGSESDTQVSLTNNFTKTLTRSFVKSLNAGDALTLNLGVNIVGDDSGFNAGLMPDPNSVGTQPCYSLTITRIG